MERPNPSTSGQYRELLRLYFLPQWPSAAALLVLLLCLAAVEVARPWLLARFLDGARAGTPVPALGRIAALFLLLVVAGQAAGIAEAYLAERIALIATNRLRADLTLHCLRLDVAFHNENRPGELIQRIDGDVTSLSNFFSRFAVALVANAFLLCGVLAMIFTIDARLGSLLTALSVVVFAVMYRLRFAARPLWQRAMQSNAEQSGLLEEQLSATEDIRSSGATSFAMRRFLEHARDLLHGRRRAIAVDGAVGATGSLIFSLGTVAALAFGTWLFRRGDATIGTVYLIFVYGDTLSRPIQAINRQLQDLQAAAAAVRRVYDLLGTPSRIVDGPGHPMPPGPPSVELAQVRFRYLDLEPVLEDVSIRLEPGRVLGLLGRTGSGKTTITRLLLRFYDPQEGAVRIGDVDLRRPNLAEIRDHVGLVTQGVHLFHAPVRDNLTLFDASVPDDRIEEVLRELGLGGWLDGLPRGLDTPIAPAGTGLSAGEAQLLAFARVFLRDPGLVILDEATSRLDPATERRIESAVSRLFGNRTAIVVAHRLRTVLRTDDILIIEDGRILEHGTREALLADPESQFSRLLRTGLEELLA